MKIQRSFFPAASLALVFLVFESSAAQAEIAPGDPRDGFTGGGSFSAGYFRCSTTIKPPCTDGEFDLALQFNVGWMLSPRLAVNTEFTVTGPNDGDELYVISAGATLWVLPRLWVRPGVGVAWARRIVSGGFIGANFETSVSPGQVLGLDRS